MAELTAMEKDLVRRFSKLKDDKTVQVDPEEYQALMNMVIKTGLVSGNATEGTELLGEDGWNNIYCKREYVSELKPMLAGPQRSTYGNLKVEFKKDTDYPLRLPAGMASSGEKLDIQARSLALFRISNDYLYMTKTKAEKLPRLIIQMADFDRKLPWSLEAVRRYCTGGNNDVTQGCYSNMATHRCNGFRMSQMTPDTPVKLLRIRNMAAWHILCPYCKKVPHVVWVGDTYNQSSTTRKLVDRMTGYQGRCRYVNIMIAYNGMMASTPIGNKPTRSKWYVNMGSGNMIPMDYRNCSHAMSYLLAEDAIKDAMEHNIEIVAGKAAQDLLDRGE